MAPGLATGGHAVAGGAGSGRGQYVSPMPSAALPPIAGIHTDPEPPPIPPFVRKLDAIAVGGIGYRALRRYSVAKVGLLANGTAYYLFLALFSILAFAFGIAALLGADWMAQWLTDALEQALPGVIGEQGIDPAALKATGATAGVLGLLVLLYSGTGAVSGAAASMHLIYGAPPDPRNFVLGKVRAGAILVAVGPFIALSFVTVEVARQLLGVPWPGYLLGLGVDFLILWLLLGILGGIRPEPFPRKVAAGVGAVGMALVKTLLGAIMAWALDKPQYGVFAAPLAILLILQLFSLVLYLSACLAAGISDKDVPIEEFMPGAEPVEAVAAEGEAVEEEPGPAAPESV